MSQLDALRRASETRKAVQSILSRVEGSTERVVTVEGSFRQLQNLSAKQRDLLHQALQCVVHDLNRAAVVLAWAAFMDFLHDRLLQDGLASLRKARPKWPLHAREDLRKQPDHQLVEAAKECGLLTGNDMKALLGMLNTRNECAHPEDVEPDFNIALGYLSALAKRIQSIEVRRSHTL